MTSRTRVLTVLFTAATLALSGPASTALADPEPVAAAVSAADPGPKPVIGEPEPAEPDDIPVTGSDISIHLTGLDTLLVGVVRGLTRILFGD